MILYHKFISCNLYIINNNMFTPPYFHGYGAYHLCYKKKKIVKNNEVAYRDLSKNLAGYRKIMQNLCKNRKSQGMVSGSTGNQSPFPRGLPGGHLFPN